MLRGAFGHGLKKAFCAMHHRDCNICQVTDHCGYHEIFESQVKDEDIIHQGFKYKPHPYVINYIIPEEIEKKILKDLPESSAGRPLSFQITIFGEYVKYIPYFVFAFQLMGENGLGKERIPYDLVSVNDYFSLEKIYSDGKLSLDKLTEQNLSRYTEARFPIKQVINGSKKIKLDFLSPARFIKKGKPLKSLDKAFLAQSISLRYGIMNQMYGFFNDKDSISENDFNIIDQNLEFNQWQRFSSRQNKKHNHEGVTGNITLESFSEKFSYMLCTMEILNIGKNTSFGLGKVRVEEI
jgi:hypothetical protein